MGSATTQARTATTAALDATSAVDLDVARDLFSAARALDDSTHLRGALADSSASPESRAKLVRDVFGAGMVPTGLELLTVAVQQRWSSASDLIDGIDDLAVRAASLSAPDADVEGELFEFSRTVADNPELELALGSRVGDAAAKGALVNALLGGRVSDATSLIVTSLARQPRDRRVRALLNGAMKTVAQQRGRTVATVVSAVPLSAAQSDRLAAALSAKYGKRVSINTVIDSSVVGGLRVQIADDVIDASVSSRLADLRQRLAG